MSVDTKLVDRLRKALAVAFDREAESDDANAKEIARLRGALESMGATSDHWQDKHFKLKAKHNAILVAAEKARDLLEGDVVTAGTSSLRKPVVAAHAVLVAACGGEMSDDYMKIAPWVSPEVDRLREFAEYVMGEVWENNEPDHGSIQDKAEALGLIELRAVSLEDSIDGEAEHYFLNFRKREGD